MKVLNIKDREVSWALASNQPNYLYIGRGPGRCDILNTPVGQKGWLGNPIVKGELCLVCGDVHHDEGSTLPCYFRALCQRLENDEFLNAFMDISAEHLVCWCAPNPCHGDVISAALKGISVCCDTGNRWIEESVIPEEWRAAR